MSLFRRKEKCNHVGTMEIIDYTGDPVYDYRLITQCTKCGKVKRTIRFKH